MHMIEENIGKFIDNKISIDQKTTQSEMITL